ncbi:MAG: sigma-54 dependent transcriptional regulator [Tepidisphaeraceae bacterium]
MTNAPEELAAKRLNVLVVDDEPSIRKTLGTFLEAEGHVVTGVANLPAAFEAATRNSLDVVFLDIRLGVASGLDALPQLIASNPWVSIIIMTAHGSIETAVEAIRRGAIEYLTKPFVPSQLRSAIERVTKIRSLEQRLAALEPTSIEGEIGPQAVLADTSGPAMRQAVLLANRVAASNANVLLCGESGTGKGLLASYIHRLGDRSKRPFVTVAAPSLTATLAESELFGHVRGAFTGAVRDHAGKIAAAEGGTLFLDEIGDLPLELQPKLLRFLQDRTYERVGDTTPRRGNVRLICATNVDLAKAVAEKRFREDLLYRINVVQIDLPPLRERPDDVLPIAERMLAYFREQKAIRGFTDEAAAALRQYGWPGNVRELRNIVERATVVCDDEFIGIEHLSKVVRPSIPDEEPGALRLGDPVPFERLEAEHLRLLIQNSESLEQVAKILQIDVTTLWRRRRRFGL